MAFEFLGDLRSHGAGKEALCAVGTPPKAQAVLPPLAEEAPAACGGLSPHASTGLPPDQARVLAERMLDEFLERYPGLFLEVQR